MLNVECRKLKVECRMLKVECRRSAKMADIVSQNSFGMKFDTISANINC